MTTQRGVEHVKGPVTPHATHTVTCACGFTADAVGVSAADAIAKYVERHRHPGATFTAKEIAK